MGTTSIRCGLAMTDYAIMILKDNGKVCTCGYNGYGQMGLNNNTDQHTLIEIPVEDVTGVFAGGSDGRSACYLVKGDGTVYGCGNNDNYGLGIGNTTQQKVFVKINLTHVVAVACTGYYALFLRRDGSVYGVGYNNYGQLGVGSDSNKVSYRSGLTRIGISNVVDIATGGDDGGYHTLFLKADGSVWACGYNGYGQLGIGSADNNVHSGITRVPNMKNVVAISTGTDNGNSSYFVKADGTAWCCGYNGNGQLGLGNTTQQNSPVQITNLDDIINVCSGCRHSLFLKANGDVYAAGYNQFGQLGDGTTTQRNTHVKVLIEDVVGFCAEGDDGSASAMSMFLKHDKTEYIV